MQGPIKKLLLGPSTLQKMKCQTQLENCSWSSLPNKIISKSMVFVVSFFISSIAKLFPLFCEIVDCRYDLVSFGYKKNFWCLQGVILTNLSNCLKTNPIYIYIYIIFTYQFEDSH